MCGGGLQETPKPQNIGPLPICQVKSILQPLNQRLQLAAALLRKPKLLVLDEATNALDVDAQDAVLRAVFDAAAGATVVMVSHRAGTQALADHVIRLDPPGDR